jgi:hypothetical protein
VYRVPCSCPFPLRMIRETKPDMGEHQVFKQRGGGGGERGGGMAGRTFAAQSKRLEGSQDCFCLAVAVNRTEPAEVKGNFSSRRCHKKCLREWRSPVEIFAKELLHLVLLARHIAEAKRAVRPHDGGILGARESHRRQLQPGSSSLDGRPKTLRFSRSFT